MLNLFQHLSGQVDCIPVTFMMGCRNKSGMAYGAKNGCHPELVEGRAQRPLPTMLRQVQHDTLTHLKMPPYLIIYFRII